MIFGFSSTKIVGANAVISKDISDALLRVSYLSPLSLSHSHDDVLFHNRSSVLIVHKPTALILLLRIEVVGVLRLILVL